jgi:CubicO group peptidase (beta-lactamase class C family)
MQKAYARQFFAALLITVVSVIAFGAEPLPRAKPEDVGLSSERLNRLTTTFQKYVDDGKLSGGVILVARKGKLAYLQPFGFRDREAKSTMRDDSIFRIASQTKALTSVAIMTLQEQGKLLLTDPVGKFLPEFMETTVAVPRDGGGYEVVKAQRPITIRDLLTHMAGLSYADNGPAADKWKAAGIQGWYFADRDEPVSATVSRMAALPFDAQPGEKWIYGYAIDVLGVVVEKASGKKLDEYIRTTITEPLKMADTQFYLPKAQRDRLAAVYAGDKQPVARVAEGLRSDQQGAYVEGPRKSFSGGAGLLSTAGDYGRFLQMLLNGGELDGVRILGRKSVELMIADHIPGKDFRPGQGFGLGFSIVKDEGAFGMPTSPGEFGWGGAYHSTYWVDPKEQLVVVYLTQLRPAPTNEDQDKLRALIYQAIVD